MCKKKSLGLALLGLLLLLLSYLDVNLITKYLAHSPSHSLVMGRSLITMLLLLPLLALSHQNLHLDTSTTTVKKQQQQQQQRSPARHVSTSAILCLFLQNGKKLRKIMQKVEGRRAKDAELLQLTKQRNRIKEKMKKTTSVDAFITRVPFFLHSKEKVELNEKKRERKGRKTLKLTKRTSQKKLQLAIV